MDGEKEGKKEGKKDGRKDKSSMEKLRTPQGQLENLI